MATREFGVDEMSMRIGRKTQRRFKSSRFEVEVAKPASSLSSIRVERIFSHMNVRLTALALLIATGTASAAIAPASAQEVIGPRGIPVYNGWQPAWDRYEFDRHHVILGTVAGFEPFRLQVARRNGNIQTIDLKQGTVILPTGLTPAVNERVAVVGYYSQGTFIANRLVLRR